MGCNASKLSAEGAAIQNKLRHRFHLRLEDIRRKKISRGLKATPSKKELLQKHSYEEEDDFIASDNEPLVNDGRKSLPSTEHFASRLSHDGSNAELFGSRLSYEATKADRFESRLSYEGPKADHCSSWPSYEGQKALQATAIKTKEAAVGIESWTPMVKDEAKKKALCNEGSVTPKAKYEADREDSCNVAHSLAKVMDEIKRENFPGNETSSNGSFKMNLNERNETLLNAAAVATQEVKTADVAGLGHVEDEDEDDDGGRRLSYTGSPSFRIYFADNNKDNDEGKNDGCNYSFERGTSSRFKAAPGFSNSSFRATSSFNDSSQRGSATLAVSKDLVNKKAKRGKGLALRKVIPKGGHTAVKNLFNMRSCTGRSSVHDHTRLPTEIP